MIHWFSDRTLIFMSCCSRWNLWTITDCLEIAEDLFLNQVTTLRSYCFRWNAQPGCRRTFWGTFSGSGSETSMKFMIWQPCFSIGTGGRSEFFSAPCRSLFACGEKNHTVWIWHFQGTDTLRCLWNYLGTSGSGSGLKSGANGIRNLNCPCICGTGKICGKR